MMGERISVRLFRTPGRRYASTIASTPRCSILTRCQRRSARRFACQTNFRRCQFIGEDYCLRIEEQPAEMGAGIIIRLPFRIYDIVPPPGSSNSHYVSPSRITLLLFMRRTPKDRLSKALRSVIKKEIGW